MSQNKKISIVVPVYNEEGNLPIFYAKLAETMIILDGYDYEIIFVDDGSGDHSLEIVKELSAKNSRVQYIEFSRNFGKEMALTAGIHHCVGDVCITLDADLQHPTELIPEFIKKWEQGAEVVIGVREKNKSEGFVKRVGSFLFYSIITRISPTKIIPRSTDFRLMDRVVIQEFKKFTERNRMARALIDWLGFKRECIYFTAHPRMHGRPSYSFLKLLHLAFNGFISLSLLPLKLAGYLGVFIMCTVGPFGFYVLIGKYIFGWVFASNFSGPAQLALLIIFFVGVILSSIGLVAFYIAHIHSEVLGRPLYIIRQKKIKHF